MNEFAKEMRNELIKKGKKGNRKTQNKIQKKTQNRNPLLKTTPVKKRLSILLSFLLSFSAMAIMFVGIGELSGCASDTQSAPCAGYGKWCTKTPINSWDSGRT